MKGFPNHIATRQDYENLLSMDEFKEETLNKLKELAGFDDRIVTRATKPINLDDPMSEWETEEIPNPYPLHAQKGFIDAKQKDESEKIKQGWYELPKLIATTEKRKYEDVLVEFADTQPIKEVDEKDVIMEDVIK